MEKVVCFFRSAIYWGVFNTQSEDCYCCNIWNIKNDYICRTQKAKEVPRSALWPETINYEQKYVSAKLPSFTMRTCMPYSVAITEMMSIMQTDLLCIHWSQMVRQLQTGRWTMDMMNLLKFRE